jgi:hypothetical protein
MAFSYGKRQFTIVTPQRIPKPYNYIQTQLGSIKLALQVFIQISLARLLLSQKKTSVDVPRK